jgi:hypothetical protein
MRADRTNELLSGRREFERFDEEALNALADSIRERGVLQPIIVQPPAFAAEEVEATEAGDHQFRLNSVPTFAFGLAKGDVVRARQYDADLWSRSRRAWEYRSAR